MDNPTTLSDMKSVICPNCGANLSYKPGTTSLVCEHCGSSFDIKTDASLVAEAQKENDLETVLTSGGQVVQPQTQAFVVKCPACGAQSSMKENMFSGNCAFCGSPLTVKPDTQSVAHPQAVLPFKLEKTAATASFTAWLRKLWFAPNNLKKTASADRFNGVYLPFWTFDADTVTNYNGERGHRVSYTVRNSKGVNEHRTRIDWTPVSGQVSDKFDDVLVTASRALPEKYLDRLQPWDLGNLAPYDNRYLSGFLAEVSQVGIQEGYKAAKGVMAVTIDFDIKNDIGGDAQRINNEQTRYSNTSYKYILLPVWLSVYRYGSRVYHFVVNARTGEVHGERPYSAIKIALAVIAGLIIIGLLIYFFGGQQ